MEQFHLPFMRGASYMTLGKSVRMWEQWDEAQVRRDFENMQKAGMNTAKIYLFWGFFFAVPEEGLNETAMERLEKCVAIAHEFGIRLIVDLMVGHMSGENYIAPWTEGRDLMHDPAMLRWEAKYIELITRRYRGDERILMWDVCNEISLYRLGRDGAHRDFPALYNATIGVLGEPPSRDECYLWLKTLADAARKGDGTHPVYSGVGTARGFSLKDVAELTDMNACYAYNWGHTQNQASYLGGFERALASAYGLPSLVEEFGVSKVWNGERYEADFYAATLYTALLNGCAGALSWQYCDFQQIIEKDPYLYHAWEGPFGMVRDDGSLRPCCDVMKEFADFMEGDALKGLSLPEADIHILLHETYDTPHAFNSAGQQEERGVFYEAYRRLRDSGLRVDFIAEEDAFSKAKCILVLGKTASKIKSTTWYRLQDYVKEGGCLWSEMDGLGATFNFNELHGVEIDFMRACKDRMLHFEGALAGMEEFRVGRNVHFIVMDAKKEEVWARDEEGDPMIICHPQGKGKTLLSVLPLFSFSGGVRDERDQDEYQPLFAALRDALGISPKASFDKPGLEAGILSHENRHAVICVNHRAGKGYEAELKIGFPVREIRDMDSGEKMAFEKTPAGASVKVEAKRGEVKKFSVISE